MKLIITVNTIVTVLFILSCTKTEDYEAQPQNRILEYKITNLADTVLYGSIDNIENTITVYIPFYHGMSVIDPVIQLENGAILKEENLPVSVKDTTYTYTVVSSDGISRTYKLMIYQENHVPMNLFIATTGVMYPEGMLTLMGDLMSTSTETMDMIFINRRTGDTVRIDENKPTSIELNNSIYELPHSYLLRVSLLVSMDSGSYDIHVTHLGRSEKLPQPLIVTYRNPAIANTWSAVTVKPGGEMMFLPGSGSLIIDPKTVSMTIAGTVYPLTILSKSTRKALYVQLPENIPTGNHGYIPFVFKFGEWNPVTSNVPIIISAE